MIHLPITILATKAVHISEYYRDRNPIPEDRNLYISRFIGVGDVYRSLIGFDLPNLPGLIPSGAAIGNAYLQLMLCRNDLQSGTITASLWRCREEWDLTTVTWNSQPATVDIPDMTFTIPSVWTGLITLNVTGLVRDWLSGAHPNYGFMLRGDEANDRVVGFSAEASLVIMPFPEKPSTEQVISETVFMDYPLRPEPRYGYGKPAHLGLAQLLNSNRSTYVNNMEDILSCQRLFREIPVSVADGASHPRWKNQWISGFDAISLCGFLGQSNPERYLEIGSGESTRFARWAIDRFNLRTRITSIDPAPRREVDGFCDRIFRDRVENVGHQPFSELESGDIVFVDSSHRVLMNSDVTAIFLDILPKLPKGVLVHFHDIFLPYDYPPAWIGRYYAEQYLLAVYLLARGQNVEVIQPNYYISSDPELSRILEPIWEEMPHITSHGASFWIRVR